MDVIDAVDRLHRAHAQAELSELRTPGAQTEWTLDQIARAIAPRRLPADLETFWCSVDPDTIVVAPCPRPAGPALSLRLWQRHCAHDATLAAYFPWCYDSHEFLLVALDQTGESFSWSGGESPVVRAFPSVTAYLDLLATMIELREFTSHPELGVIEFDPDRRWADAQAVRLATADKGRRPSGPTGPTGAGRAARAPQPSTIADLLARAEAGQSPSGSINARVVALSGSASGSRIEVTDGTGRLDVWCPATLGANGPIIERTFEFQVTLRPGCQQLGDSASALSGIERATRAGDLRAAVTLATPLYDALFTTPAMARATAVRPIGRILAPKATTPWPHGPGPGSRSK